MATTAPLGHYFAGADSVLLKTAYLIFLITPYAVVFVFLILALNNIRAILIKYGQRMKLHKRWIIAHIIAFSIFFVTDSLAKTYVVFTVTSS